MSTFRFACFITLWNQDDVLNTLEIGTIGNEYLRQRLSVQKISNEARCITDENQHMHEKKLQILFFNISRTQFGKVFLHFLTSRMKFKVKITVRWFSD